MTAGGGALGLLVGVVLGILQPWASDTSETAGPPDLPPATTVESPPFESTVTIEIPTGALPDGVDVAIGSSEDDRQPLSVGEWRSPPFTLDADGNQPERPLRALIPLDGLAGTNDPELLSLVRWDPSFEVWVPVTAEISSDGTTLIAHIDHLSLFRVQEWQVWEDLDRGVRLTGQQVRDLYTGSMESVRRNGRRAAEGFNELLQVGQDVTTGWLGIGGAEPPTCEQLETGFELVSSHAGDERPLHACQEPGSHDDEIVLRVANNRAYGMLIDVPRDAQIRLEDWPDLGIGGQAAGFAFFELLESAFGVGTMYLPPGAQGRITLDVTDRDEALVVATSTPAYTGLDLAGELLAAIYLDSAELGIDTLNCLTRGGRSLLDIVGGPDAQDIGALFEALRICALELGSETLLELVGIFRSMLATVPALASNLIDTDWSTFTVNVQVQLQRIPEIPRQAFYAVSFSSFATSVLYLISDGEVTEIGELRDAGWGVTLTDIAEYDGELYATSFSHLYRLDVEELEATRIGRFDRGSVNSLAFTDDGRMFVAGENGNFMQIDPTTAETIQNWSLPGGHRADGDLLATSEGLLWLTTRDNQLVLIDPSTGELREESPQLGGVSDLWGLTRDSEGLIALGGRAEHCPGSGLYRIETATFATTAVGCLDFTPGGATRPLSR